MPYGVFSDEQFSNLYAMIQDTLYILEDGQKTYVR